MSSFPPELHEVSDGVFAYVQPDGSWWINNAGLIVGRRGAAAVDACATERRTRAFLDTIATVTDRPVRTLINTHHHGDHTHGNHLFGGATIVAHERTRDEVIAAGPPDWPGVWTPIDWGEIEIEPPFLTYTDGVTVWVDELRCEVRHVGGAAHTTILVMGSVAGSIRVCEQVLAPLGAQTIVPGHGGVAGPSLIDDVLGYLRFVADVARRGREAGRTPLETARETDLGEYAGLLDPERIVGNLHRAYAELDGAEPGARIDVRAAVLDMVAYNGGQPLRCYA